jgi:hypothetical protein
MVALTGREDAIVAECRICKTQHTLLVQITDFADWQLGGYIQDTMPYLSADERELLISQTCGDCWEKMFGNCEE